MTGFVEETSDEYAARLVKLQEQVDKALADKSGEEAFLFCSEYIGMDEEGDLRSLEELFALGDRWFAETVGEQTPSNRLPFVRALSTDTNRKRALVQMRYAGDEDALIGMMREPEWRPYLQILLEVLVEHTSYAKFLDQVLADAAIPLTDEQRTFVAAAKEKPWITR